MILSRTPYACAAEMNCRNDGRDIPAILLISSPHSRSMGWGVFNSQLKVLL